MCAKMLDQNAREVATFVINNLTHDNLHKQIPIITELVARYDDDVRRFLMNQLSRNRVLRESNNLVLYAEMVDSLHDAALERMLIADCVMVARELVAGGDASAAVKERLRNVSTFIGLLTVTRDEPLTAELIDVKQEIQTAIKKDDSTRLCLLVTLVCHLLKYCEHSTIFKKQCTWTKRIIATLTDIYQDSKTELTVCLEIERYFDTIEHKYKSDPSPAPSNGSTTSGIGSSASSSTSSVHFAPNQAPLHFHEQPPHHIEQFGYYQHPATSYVDPRAPRHQAPTPDDGDPIIRLLATRLYCVEAPIFNYLPRCAEVVVEKFTHIIAELERRFVTRHWETLNAYCDLVVMRDIAFCTDESQIRSCFHWMLRSLLLGLFQPRYAVNQVRREFSTYMQRLFKRIIEVVVAQSHPTAHAPHVIALRTMSEEEIKTLIDESVIVFTKHNQQIVTECMLILLSQRAMTIADCKQRELLSSPNRVQLALQHFIGGPRSQIELNFKLPPLLRRTTSALKRDQFAIYAQHDAIANTLHSYMEQYGIVCSDQEF